MLHTSCNLCGWCRFRDGVDGIWQFSSSPARSRLSNPTDLRRDFRFSREFGVLLGLAIIFGGVGSGALVMTGGEEERVRVLGVLGRAMTC